MKIDNKFTTVNYNRQNNPSFGITTKVLDEFVEICPEIEEIAGKEILPFIKEQEAVILDYKSLPKPHFILNWTNKDFVPDSIALKAYIKGGFKIEVASEKIREFLNISKVMTNNSNLARIKVLEESKTRIEANWVGDRKSGVHNEQTRQQDLTKVKEKMSQSLFTPEEKKLHRKLKNALIRLAENTKRQEFSEAEKTYSEMLNDLIYPRTSNVKNTFDRGRGNPFVKNRDYDNL